LKEVVNQDAMFSLTKTILISILLFVSSLYFNKDANDLILIPIEQMIDRVRKISRNPIKAIEDVENAAFLSEENEEQVVSNLETKFLEE